MMPVVSFDYIKQHEKMREEINRLRVQNIQMQAALGYAICAEDERHIIPSNPYSCGVCDAANKWPNRRTETLDYLGQVGQLSDEIERLRAALLTGVCMLSEKGLDPREKCQMAYDHMSAALEGKNGD